MADTEDILCEWMRAFEKAGCQLTMGDFDTAGATFYQVSALELWL